MSASINAAVPVLPAANTAESLEWWTRVCGFTEIFRDNTPPTYAGIGLNGTILHLAALHDADLARTVGEQTVVRLMVDDIEAIYAEYRQRGGQVHPNGPLQAKAWGKEFSAIDPNGVCVTFQSSSR